MSETVVRLIHLEAAASKAHRVALAAFVAYRDRDPDCPGQKDLLATWEQAARDSAIAYAAYMAAVHEMGTP